MLSRFKNGTPHNRKNGTSLEGEHVIVLAWLALCSGTECVVVNFSPCWLALWQALNASD
jgi:hypothetical protein